MAAREIETPGPPAAAPDGDPLDAWAVAAVGPDWRPPPGELELAPAEGRLLLYPDALVFRADAVVDRGTGAPLVSVIPAGSVIEAGPLSPGSRLTPSEIAGRWMPRPLRRIRCPGFAVRTTAGSWAFDCPYGQRRAREVSDRYA